MSDSVYEFRNRSEGVTIPHIWVAFVLSVLLHAALLWEYLPKLHLLSPDITNTVEHDGDLVVRLAPAPSPPTPSPPPGIAAQRAPRESHPAPPPQRASPPPPPSRPQLALNSPVPNAAVSPPPSPPPVASANPPRPPGRVNLDSLYSDARRFALNDPAPPSVPANTQSTGDKNSRLNSVVAANLAAQPLTFGYDPSRSGGAFQIKRIGFEDAELMFYGWNKDIRRNAAQQYDILKGNNSNIQLAVVRKIIAIIRQYEPESFNWESHRLGRQIKLSSKMADNAALEEFMLQEFFDDDPRAAR